MAKKVTFSRDYDYTHASRAVTAFKKGWTGTVKDEIADAAGEAGALEGVTAKAADSKGEAPKS